ncbi:MAG TPA: hypothetical protein VMU94_22310 [Streptosporangiaceae bacterium]|nr:hypothetical protein [Streptosporangiaceae bacterium]
MVTARRAIADTSVFVGLEAERFDVSRFSGFEWGISAITLGELRLGVPQAKIAATAIAHGIPIVTQDAVHDAMPDVQVIKI